MIDKALKAQIAASCFAALSPASFQPMRSSLIASGPVQRWATFRIKPISMRSQQKNGLTAIPTLLSSCIEAENRPNIRLRLIFGQLIRQTQRN
jgi:hypothetical protein